MGLIELLACVGNDNLEFQKLRDCLTSVKEKKRDKCTELSFLTQAITPNDVAMGTGKIGLVVWVDQDVMSKAYEDALKAANYAAIAINAYDANQALITKQAEQLKMLRSALEAVVVKVNHTHGGSLGSSGSFYYKFSENVFKLCDKALEATKPVEE